jgi:hypothetical protein
MKIGAKVVSHGRCAAFQMVESPSHGNVSGAFAPDRGTTTATATSASNEAFDRYPSTTDGRSASKCQAK